MKRRRGRLPALWSAACASVVLTGAGYALRGRIQQEYWLWRLDRGDEAEKRVAAEKLGEMRGPTTLTALLSLEFRLLSSPTVEDPFSGENHTLIYAWKAIEKISRARPGLAVPLLINALGNAPRPWQKHQGNELRIGAANLLGELGTNAVPAIPALTEALTDSEGRFAKYADEALRKIRGE